MQLKIYGVIQKSKKNQNNNNKKYKSCFIIRYYELCKKNISKNINTF